MCEFSLTFTSNYVRTKYNLFVWKSRFQNVNKSHKKFICISQSRTLTNVVGENKRTCFELCTLLKTRKERNISETLQKLLENMQNSSEMPMKKFSWDFFCLRMVLNYLKYIKSTFNCNFFKGTFCKKDSDTSCSSFIHTYIRFWLIFRGQADRRIHFHIFISAYKHCKSNWFIATFASPFCNILFDY